MLENEIQALKMRSSDAFTLFASMTTYEYGFTFPESRVMTKAECIL